MNWVWFILVGIVAGFLAGLVVKGRGFGLLGNLIIGVIGAVLGGFIFGRMRIPTNDLMGALVCAFLGSIVLLVLLGFVGGKKK